MKANKAGEEIRRSCRCAVSDVRRAAEQFETFCGLAEPLLRRQHPGISTYDLYRQLVLLFDKCNNVRRAAKKGVF
jgi:hypothetical protein